MRVVVATHGHCFDGLCSAVLFTRLVREVEGIRSQPVYRSCGYGVAQTRPERALDGDVTAVLDYRFCAEPAPTWYFDHHRTAFQRPGDRDVFERGTETGRYFFDPDCTSCTKLIARAARDRFGLEFGEYDELVRRADQVDSADFASPDQAINRDDPEMQLVSVVERHGGDNLITELAAQLLERPLSEVAREPLVAERYAPIRARHERFVTRVRQTAEQVGRVVFVDMTDGVDAIEKFVTYALYPRSQYSVVVGAVDSSVKISVGFNPWSGSALDTDISAICARYGGGGHPVVGGIAFPRRDVDRARRVARSIVRELNGERPE